MTEKEQRHPLQRFATSIVTRICLSILVVEGIILSGLGWHYTDYFRKEIDLRISEKLAQPGILMSLRAMNFSAVLDWEVIGKLVQEEVVEAFIFKNDGKIFYTVDFHKQDRDYQEFLLPEEREVFDKRLLFSQQTSFLGADGQRYISIRSPLWFKDDLLGGLYLRVNGDRVQVKKDRIRTLFLLGSLLVIVLTSIIEAVVVYRLVIARIRKTNATLSQVEDGNLAARVSDSSADDELGQMMSMINAMIANTESNVNQLTGAALMEKHYAETLESQIVARTRELEEKNTSLRETVDKLNVETARRERVTAALRESERHYRNIMQAALAGMFIIENFVFRYVNPMFLEMGGFTMEEVLHKLGPFEVIVPEEHDLVREKMLNRIEGVSGETYQVTCVRKDGSRFEALVRGEPSTWQGRPALVGTVFDISELKTIEKELKARKQLLVRSLEEKEVLLREVCHRTKNNMLVIISMIELQLHEIHDEKARAIFRDTENRIRAMSMVHEKLYKSEDLVEINLAEYLEDMVETLVGNMVLHQQVSVAFRVNPVPVSIDHAVPLGLAVNEIVTNAIQHAFPGNREGEIVVELDQDDQRQIKVVIRDNGVGVGDQFNLHTISSFGMQMTVNLVEKQLKGSCVVRDDNGTEVAITFIEPERLRRI